MSLTSVIRPVLRPASALLLVAGILAAAEVSAADMHMSPMFMGVKANKGTVTHSKVDGKNVLTLSDDFVVPDSPAPHWQVLDSKGNTYLLQRLQIKGDKLNKSITMPGYVMDIAKVQIWCAWAEVLLGETTFDKPVK